MKNILVITGWESESLIKQTPNCNGMWGNYKFFIHSNIEDVDVEIDYLYLIVIYHLPNKFEIKVPKGNTLLIIQEPPYSSFQSLSKNFKYFDKVITQFPTNDKNIIHEQPLIPWWVGKTYNELKNIDRIEKLKDLSWITSNKSFLPGHNERMNFKNQLDKSDIDYDLFGKGYQFIDTKWEGLAPYKYSLSIENGSFKHYWTEKIADCFLSNTMPIYYGCPDIEDYFPAEAMIKIDITNPKEAFEIITDAIRGEKWENAQDALRHSKLLILDKFQFFPFVTDFIEKNASNNMKVNYIFPIAGWPKENLIENLTRRLKKYIF